MEDEVLVFYYESDNDCCNGRTLRNFKFCIIVASVLQFAKWM